MKRNRCLIYKHFCLLLLLVLNSIHIIFAQNIEITGDTIEISINGFNGGNIQWQFSNDNSNWKDISGANEPSLKHRITESGLFRAKVSDGNCSYFSETNSIEAFNFNYRDENGKPRISKNSEYLILIPDIQNYISADENNIYFENIIEWILKFSISGHIVKAVLQVGDVTNLNSIQEWEKAQKIFSRLDNKIDYILTTGNHDYGDNGITNTRNTYFSDYFNYKHNSSFNSSYEKNKFENAYFRINIHNQPFQIFTLEFGPRNKTIAWADSIAKANPNDFKMLITHAYLYKNQERYNFIKHQNSQTISPYAYANLFPKEFGLEKVNDGEDLWNKLIYPNDNFKFVLCGHKTDPNYIGNLVSADHNNKNVLQMLFNTQSLPMGGEGWIQILEFFDDKKTVTVKTYSTYFDLWNEQDTHQFNFMYNN